jgi:hypothetical protein
MEDEELLKDEDVGDVVGHRLTAQPSVIKHGQMREYQMQGLNWLIHLYDNGINGILADEMVRCPACHSETCTGGRVEGVPQLEMGPHLGVLARKASGGGNCRGREKGGGARSAVLNIWQGILGCGRVGEERKCQMRGCSALLQPRVLCLDSWERGQEADFMPGGGLG